MTVFTFYGGENFTSLKVKGHAMYGEYGSDIVCAAVSASVSLLELSVVEILGEKRSEFKLSESDDDVEITYCDPSDISKDEADKLRCIKCAFYKYALSLEENYKENISIVKRR